MSITLKLRYQISDVRYLLVALHIQSEKRNLGFMHPLFISIPHSGESFPSSASWLKGLSEPTLMRDVDRFVDKLYQPVIQALKIPSVVTEWHRYVVDLNRKPDEFDQAAVEGASHPKGKHPKGLHWSVTTHGETLIAEPMPMGLHQEFLEKYYEPFHAEVKKRREDFRAHGEVYHIDAHSMPSLGTELHPDPGEERAEIVVSDFHGQSASSEFRDIVMEAYQEAGFQVGYNWPYVGGGITQTYGAPEEGFHSIQVELNRKLYMDEETKKMKPLQFESVQKQISHAIDKVYHRLQRGQ